MIYLIAMFFIVTSDFFVNWPIFLQFGQVPQNRTLGHCQSRTL